MDWPTAFPRTWDDVAVRTEHGWEATTAGLLVLSALWTVLWLALDWSSRSLRLGTAKVNTSQQRCRSFLLSTIHAILVAAFSGYKMLVVGNDNLTLNRELATITMGYFVSDWIGSLKAYWNHPAEFVHHVMAIAVTLAVLVMPILAEFIPHWLVVEGSTPFYNATWFFKKNGQAESLPNRIATGFFVLSFFLLRVVWLPYATYNVIFNNRAKWLQMIPICLLQFYWFFLIMQQVIKLLTGKTRKAHMH